MLGINLSTYKKKFIPVSYEFFMPEQTVEENYKVLDMCVVIR